MSSLPAHHSRLERTWRRSGAALARYADRLARLTWKRFFLIALLALIAASILGELPPLDRRWGGTTVVRKARPPAEFDPGNYEVRVEKGSIRIGPTASAPPAASGVPLPGITVPLPPGADAEDVRDAIDEARQELSDALKEAGKVVTVGGFRPGDALMTLTMFAVVASIIAKMMGAGQRKAEARAAAATEAAEGEALKRQVVEARMAAMQAQVEPHFLFNTLASIDHLIETDPARASRMQKNLIALLRASMPTMREAAADGGAPRDLGRELEVVRPYLEILKMRMEERLAVTIDVPDGLLSAEFPSMMMQSLVENAVKHGLEPKPDGGALLVKAEIVHGKLALTVADTGLGFGQASAGAGPLPSQPAPAREAASEASVGAQPTTAGTGVGLANIRERLQLLYGTKATLAIRANVPSGTAVTITVPYRTTNDG